MKTPEEIKQIAIECGFDRYQCYNVDNCCSDAELQEFYQLAYEDGMKAQIEIDSELETNYGC